jgi:hypothetical protein
VHGLLFVVNLEINLNRVWVFYHGPNQIFFFFLFFFGDEFLPFVEKYFFQKNNIMSNVPVFLPPPPPKKKNSPRMKFFCHVSSTLWFKQVAFLYMDINIFLLS